MQTVMHVHVNNVTGDTTRICRKSFLPAVRFTEFCFNSDIELIARVVTFFIAEAERKQYIYSPNSGIHFP